MGEVVKVKARTYVDSNQRVLAYFDPTDAPAIRAAIAHMHGLGLEVELITHGTWEAKHVGEQWSKAQLLFIERSSPYRAEAVRGDVYRLHGIGGYAYYGRAPEWQSHEDSPDPATVIVRGKVPKS